jgi:predicted metal-binding membrane protein
LVTLTPIQLLRDSHSAATVGIIASLTGGAWVLLVWSVWDMDGIAGRLLMPMGEPWSLGQLLADFGMWTIMMAAMMIPSATPTALLFTAMERERAPAAARGRAAAFIAGYFGVWIAFSAVATFVQALLHDAAMISPMMTSTNRYLSAAILIATGLYQWTPLKLVCLRQCRTPLGFLMTQWREGVRGAANMGMRHGLFCVGCCWLLMSLLFVAGVMNLIWVAILTTAVAVEKLLPRGEWLARGFGVLLIGLGIATLG